jgi:hypothetical protein
MDFTPIIAKLWGALGWFTPLMLQNGTLKSPWAKEEVDELLVLLFAHWQLDAQTYLRMHNVTLSTPDGITQIDHVSLSPLRYRGHWIYLLHQIISADGIPRGRSRRPHACMHACTASRLAHSTPRYSPRETP